jgi:hypothetical protein
MLLVIFRVLARVCRLQCEWVWSLSSGRGDAGGAQSIDGRWGMLAVVNQSKLELLSQLWDEFRTMAFPRGFGIREPEGECMALTDTLVAGCIHTALDNKGSLDDWRRGVLQDRIEALVKVLPAIADDEYATEYFTHMHRMAVLAAELSAEAA